MKPTDAMTREPFWDICGSWPSDNDLDLWLVGGSALRRVKEWYRSGSDDIVPLADIPLPASLWQEAIEMADGLPLDIVMWCERGGKRIVLNVEPPYEVGVFGVGHAMFAPGMRANRRPLSEERDWLADVRLFELEDMLPYAPAGMAAPPPNFTRMTTMGEGLER